MNTKTRKTKKQVSVVNSGINVLSKEELNKKIEAIEESLKASTWRELEVLGYVPQDFGYFSEFSAKKFMLYIAAVKHVLANEEAAISQLLNGLENDLSIIYETANRAKFIVFVHSMAYRTKKFRDKMDNISNQTAQFLSDVCDNMGLSEEQKAKEIANHCTPGKEIQLYQMIEIAPTLRTMEMLLKNYDWYEAYNNTEVDFVISDSPFQTVWMGFNCLCEPKALPLSNYCSR